MKMKKVFCEFCGGMSMPREIKGMDNREVMDKAMAHMKEAHPAEVKKMMEMSKEEQDKMMMEAEKKITDAE